MNANSKRIFDLKNPKGLVFHTTGSKNVDDFAYDNGLGITRKSTLEEMKASYPSTELKTLEQARLDGCIYQ